MRSVRWIIEMSQPTQRNVAELLGTVEHGLPRASRWRTPYFVGLLIEGTTPSAGFDTKFKHDMEPNLPFIKLWAAIKTNVPASGWLIEASIQLKLKGRVVDEIAFEAADQTVAASGQFVSEFVAGVGAPANDMILLNHQSFGTGAIALAPKRFACVCDELIVKPKRIVGNAYAVAFLACEQSNVRF
jgi:hypothetical protein